MKIFPNYSQFASYGKGINFSDTKAREYRIADGVDREEYVRRGLVAAGNPYAIEPVLYYDERLGENVVTFTDMFPALLNNQEERSPRREGAPTRSDFSTIARGSQLLYVRIPISVRKMTPELTLPDVGDVLEMIHEPTGSLVRCTVKEVDGLQFRNPSTGSVFVDNLLFIIPPTL
jgi:hypothetical protein